jgi:hypothetical protein
MFRICSHLRNGDRELGYTKDLQIMYNLSVNSYFSGNYVVNKLKKIFIKKEESWRKSLKGVELLQRQK